jgi:hypothetical protein
LNKINKNFLKESIQNLKRRDEGRKMLCTPSMEV